jgi:hypothetical protein
VAEYKFYKPIKLNLGNPRDRDDFYQGLDSVALIKLSSIKSTNQMKPQIKLLQKN